MRHLIAMAVLCLFALAPASARDYGQWSNQSDIVRDWYATLMQPDNPTVSCCGEADGYWADQVETAPDGSLIAVVTDDRPDEPLHRHHVDIGTRIPVPQAKIKFDRGNPTGHIIIFLSYSNQPFCYVQNGAV